METTLDPIEAWDTLYPLHIFCLAEPKLFTVLPRRLSHLILELTLNRPGGGGGGAESAHRLVLSSAVLKR